MPYSKQFTRLDPPHSVWAIGSVRGEADRLKQLHSLLESRLGVGDKLVYLGNILGKGGGVLEAVGEVVSFRKRFVAHQNGDSSGWVTLRGRQEALFEHLMRLDVAMNPVGMMVWALDQGARRAVAAYSGDPQEGVAAAAIGPAAIREWTEKLAARLAAVPGHTEYFENLKHAAFTSNNNIVFVHAGLLADRPLDAQGDALWWNSDSFSAAKKPYYATQKIVRGYDPEFRGIVETKYSLSVDGGCGQGGKLYAVKLDATGSVIDVVAA